MNRHIKWLRYHMKFNGLIVYIPVIPVCETFGRWTLSLLVACNIWDLWDLFHCCWHSHRSRPVSSHNLIFNHIHQINCNTQPAVSKQDTNMQYAHTQISVLATLVVCVCQARVCRGCFLFAKVKGQRQLRDLEVINTTLQTQQAIIWWFAGQKTSRRLGSNWPKVGHLKCFSVALFYRIIS